MEFDQRIKKSILSLLILIPITIQSQFSTKHNNIFKDLYDAANTEYGFDQVLVNGVYFEYNFRNAIGNPYLLEDVFNEGNVVFRGKRYHGLKFKYDIYDQELLVQYPHNESQVNFYLPKELISEFTILNIYFKKFKFPNKEERFYQVIGKDMNIKVLNKWDKQRNDSDHMMPYLSYEFSKSHKSSYLLINNQLMRFRMNSSYIKKFNKNHQKSIKQYLKRNNIKVKNCSDLDMASLLEYCNTLYNEVNK